MSISALTNVGFDILMVYANNYSMMLSVKKTLKVPYTTEEPLMDCNDIF